MAERTKPHPSEKILDTGTSSHADSLHQLALDASRAYHPVLQEFVRSADKPYTVATELSTSTQPKA